MFCLCITEGMAFSLRPPTEGRQCLAAASCYVGGMEARPLSLVINTRRVQIKESVLRIVDWGKQ